MGEHASSRDYAISADVSPFLSGWNNNAGLTFSYEDHENYYMVKWDDYGQYASRSSHKDLLLVKVVDGVEVVLDKVDHIDLPNVFKLEVGASATDGITVSIDGTEMLHAPQEHPAIGIIGLNTEDNDSGITYDNVEVRVEGADSTSADSALAVVEHPGLTTVTESGSLDTDGTPIRILSLNDSGTVDLSDVASLVSDIDEISLSNGAIDLTNIEVSDVISMSDDDNTLVIHGESDDSVTLDANEWVQLDPTQYQSSDSTLNVLLQIDDAVDVII